jgi:ribosomal protein S8
MDSLLNFVVSTNQALRLQKATCCVRFSRLNKQVAFFLRDHGYLSAVTVTSTGLLLTFRYVKGVAPLRGLLVVSKLSRQVYFRNTDRTPGVYLITSSDYSLRLKSPGVYASGKALLQIL